MGSDCGSDRTRGWGGSGAGGGGSLGSCSRLGGFGREKGGERRVCCTHVRWLRNTCAVAEGLENPLPPGEIFFTCPLVSFRTKLALSLLTKPTFVHRTDFLFEALVAMLRTCVFLRHPYISAAQLQEWSMRKRVTYRAMMMVMMTMMMTMIVIVNLIVKKLGDIVVESRDHAIPLLVPVEVLIKVGFFLL